MDEVLPTFILFIKIRILKDCGFVERLFLKNMVRFLLLVLVIVTLVSCEDNHIRFVKGCVVTESRSYSGVYLKVDTTNDGLPDLEAEVLGHCMFRKYANGDTVLVDIGKWGNTAEPLTSQEKSKQDTPKYSR